MTLTRLVEDSLRKYGEYPALSFEGREYTNVEQHRAGCQVAGALAALGVSPGDRVLVMLPNCPEVIQTYAGISRLGAVIVPLIFLLGEQEVGHIALHSDARALVTSEDLYWKVEGQLDRLPALRHVLIVGGEGRGVARPFAETVARAAPLGEPAPRREDDLAVILYTSGTTGAPKGVALSHANLESNARAAASLSELPRDEWAVAVLPLSHSYGLTLMNAGNILGSRAVLLRWFNPEAVLDAIQRFRAVSMGGVPTMYVYLLNYPEAGRFDVSSMRVWGSGAAPLPVEIVAPFEEKFGGKLLEGYGLSEASPVVATHRLSGARKLGSVGQPLPGVMVSIRDEQDRELPSGEVGEICVRGPNVMLGYYRNPQETAEALRAGWLRTGDMGRLDDDGFLFVVERKKDLIIRGGLNIYPREVEEVLYAHPAIAEAAVVGMADPLMGEEVLAWVVAKPGETLAAEEVVAYCRERLSHFKCPKAVRLTDSLPKSPIGKILRRELRQRA